MWQVGRQTCFADTKSFKVFIKQRHQDYSSSKLLNNKSFSLPWLSKRSSSLTFKVLTVKLGNKTPRAIWMTRKQLKMNF